jgi:hypothetical protein
MKKALFLVILVPTLAAAQVEYAAKYVCGRSDGELGNLAAGTYFTSINVRNPVGTETRFEKTFTVSLVNERSGPVTKPVVTPMPPHASLQIDCRNILGHLRANGIAPLPGQPFEGYVVIRGGTQFDVYGIYTAAGPNGLISTMHLERYLPQRAQ